MILMNVLLVLSWIAMVTMMAIAIINVRRATEKLEAATQDLRTLVGLPPR